MGAQPWRRRISPLVFMHVPRTAGTSLRESLVAALGDERALVEVYNNDPAYTIASAPARLTPRTRVVYGHFSHGFHDTLGVPPRYAIVLRDPVARVVSLHAYLRARETALSDVSLHDYVANPPDEQVSDHMTQMLAGRRAVAAAPDEALDCAKELLSEFEFVGLTESLERDSAGLFRILGSATRAMARHNAAPPAPEPAPETIDLIRERNRLDMALYDHVRRHRRPARPAIRLGDRLRGLWPGEQRP